MFCWGVNNEPVCRVLQNLVEADSESFIFQVFLDVMFINPELGSRDNFSVGDARKVELKFWSVLLLWEIPLVSN